MNTNQEIIKIREELDLTRAELALYTGYSRSYVDNWLTSPKSRNYREAPHTALRILQLEAGIRKPLLIGTRAKRLQRRRKGEK